MTDPAASSEPGRQYELRRVVDLPAGVLQTWRAVATGAGQQAWLFPTDGETPDAEGDTLAGYRVQSWEPPHRLLLRADAGDDWFDEVEFVMEGHGADATTLHYRRSGIVVGDWENQYDSLDQHTDLYLHTLEQYLGHFAGREAVYIGAQAPPSSTEPDAFDRVRGALGLTEESAEGDPVSFEVLGAAPVEGAIDYLRPNFIGVRSADGLYRFFGRNAFGVPIALGHHRFDPRVDQLETSAWGAWLEGLFPPA